jgi:hypothetical protein
MQHARIAALDAGARLLDSPANTPQNASAAAARIVTLNFRKRYLFNSNKPIHTP